MEFLALSRPLAPPPLPLRIDNSRAEGALSTHLHVLGPEKPARSQGRPCFPMKSARFLLGALAVSGLLLQNSAYSQSYTFTTIAGVPGKPGTTDGTNNDALFSSPAGLAIDAQGDLYVSEDGSHTIRRLRLVGGQWVVTTIAGMPGQSGNSDGTNSSARFNRPRGLALDPSGAIFVADSYNSTIRRIDRVGDDWVVSTLAGAAGVLEHQDGAYTNALFRRPSAVTVGSSNVLFVADMNNHVIRQMDFLEPEWHVTTIAGFPFVAGSADGVGEAAEFGTPYGLVAVKAGTICVADTGNHAIRQVQLDPGGAIVTTIAGDLGAPAGTNDGPGSLSKFNFPAAIAAHSSGALFVSDQLNHTIRKLTRADGAWTVTTIGGLAQSSGTNDGTGSLARFQRPWGIAVDAAGNVYIADTRNHTIRKGVPGGNPAADRPTLSLHPGAGEITLSWPKTFSGYVLETRPALDPAGAWTEVPEPITTGPDTFQVTIPIANSTAFFRLRQP